MSQRCMCIFFFFKQKTAYELRISDWSSDVCSSDLVVPCRCGIEYGCEIAAGAAPGRPEIHDQWLVGQNGFLERVRIKFDDAHRAQIGRASCRERVCQYV